MTEPIQPKRRGAPLGNTNAVKHGYYAATLHRRTLEQLKDRVQPPGLEVEQRFLALLFIRVEKQLCISGDNKSSTDRYVSASMISLLILTHLLQTSGTIKGTLTQEVETALAEVFNELQSIKLKQNDRC